MLGARPPAAHAQVGLRSAPPPAFSFSVNFVDAPESGALLFQEISGMEAEMAVQSLSAGGENRYVRSMLGSVKRVNLTLRRAVAARGNKFAQWCESTFESSLGASPVTRDIRVSLQDDSGDAQMIWVFRAAWPVRWSADLVGPASNDLAIESVVLAYKSVERSMPQPRAGQ